MPAMYCQRPPEPPQDQPLDLGGVQYYRRADGIYVFRFEGLADAAVDQWVEIGLQLDRAAFAGAYQIRSIYAFTARILPTPHFIADAIHFANNTPPDLNDSVAIFIENPLMHGVINLIIRRTPDFMHQRVRVFMDFEAAVRWLEERRQLFNRPELPPLDATDATEDQP